MADSSGFQFREAPVCRNLTAVITREQETLKLFFAQNHLKSSIFHYMNSW